MLNEEALKWVDEHFLGNLDVKIAISNALEKQIPKKPNEIYCPTCGDISVFDGEYGTKLSHCYNCGQALDWSE